MRGIAPLFLTMWKLGNREIDGQVILAPMAGYTSEGYRKFFEDFSIALSYTEMVSDMGLIYGNDETLDYLPKQNSKVPVGIQLFGSEPENILKAAIIAKNKAKQLDFIDINMACPVNKVVKTGAGSALLLEPKKCGDIIRILKENFDVPITAKIRLGWDDNHLTFMEVIDELQNAGVDMIAIHARTRKDLYYGEPRFELIEGLRSKMKLPLVISGNIFSVEEAKRALDITGADAVMVARGTLGNPFLAKQIDHYLRTGEKLLEPSFNEQKDYCLSLAKLLIEEKGEKLAMRVYRAIAPHFFYNLKNVKKLKVRLTTELNTYQDLVNIIDEYEKELY